MGLVSIALTVVVSYRFFLFLLEPLIVVTLLLRRDGVQSRTLQPRTQVDSACPHAVCSPAPRLIQPVRMRTSWPPRNRKVLPCKHLPVSAGGHFMSQV